MISNMSIRRLSCFLCIIFYTAIPSVGFSENAVWNKLEMQSERMSLGFGPMFERYDGLKIIFGFGSNGELMDILYAQLRSSSTKPAIMVFVDGDEFVKHRVIPNEFLMDNDKNKEEKVHYLTDDRFPEAHVGFVAPKYLSKELPGISDKIFSWGTDKKILNNGFSKNTPYSMTYKDQAGEIRIVFLNRETLNVLLHLFRVYRYDTSKLESW